MGRDDFAVGFGERMRSAMKQAALTRAKLAYRMSSEERQVGEHDIRRWSNGAATPRADRLGSLADALGVSVDYLLGRDH